MKCERFMEQYLKLDNDEQPSLMMKLHLLRCVSCRKEVGLLRLAGEDMMKFSSSVMGRDMSGEILAHILRTQESYSRHIALYNWIVVGVIIFASIFLVTLSDSLTWLKTQFGGNLEVPFFIVMGIVVTLYTSILIGTHLDEFSRWVRYNKQ